MGLIVIQHYICLKQKQKLTAIQYFMAGVWPFTLNRVKTHGRHLSNFVWNANAFCEVTREHCNKHWKIPQRCFENKLTAICRSSQCGLCFNYLKIEEIPSAVILKPQSQLLFRSSGAHCLAFRMPISSLGIDK